MGKPDSFSLTLREGVFSVSFLWVFPFIFWCFLMLFMIPDVQDSDTNVSYIPEEASDMSDSEDGTTYGRNLSEYGNFYKILKP